LSQVWRVSFIVGLAAPDHVSIVFELVWATILLALGTMGAACEGSVIPFPTVAALWDTGVY